jgi:hypothetical protein
MNHVAEQLMLPLQGLVNFFSPPVPTQSKLPVVSMRLAKSPALPSEPKHMPRELRTQNAGILLMSTSLLGQMPERTDAEAGSRVLRSRRAQDGRIVIVGRMRDVCAELDRLCDEPIALS